MKARLFVAVWPSPEVVEALRALPRPEVPGLRWTTAAQWHVTLAFLGSRDLEATITAFRAVKPPPGPVVAQVGPETGRFGTRIVHLPVAGLDEVAAAVRASLPGDDDRPFSGHLTLARARDRVDRSALYSVVGVPLSASFPVVEVALVSSSLGRGPAAYEVVERLAL